MNILLIAFRFLLEVIWYTILLPVKIFLIFRLVVIFIYAKLRFDISFKEMAEIVCPIMSAEFKREAYWVKYNQIKDLSFFMEEGV